MVIVLINHNYNHLGDGGDIRGCWIHKKGAVFNDELRLIIMIMIINRKNLYVLT